jgi:ABC-type nitrate/sulfonate/bicarbonate transport system substrate-binding protein
MTSYVSRQELPANTEVTIIANNPVQSRPVTRRRGRAARLGMTSAAVLLATMAGCSSSSSGGGATTTSGLSTVRLVYDWPSVDFEAVPIAVGLKQGFYKKQGLNIDLVLPPNNQTTVKMLAVGKGDIGFDSTVDVVFARAAQIPVVSVANYTQDNDWGLVAKPGATIDLSSLRGESIGVFTDSWTKAMMPYVLRAGNVSAGDVKQIIFQSNDLSPMLAGKINIATNTTNFAVAQVQAATGEKPSVKLATSFGAPNVPIWVYVATSSWLSTHGSQARAFLAGTKEALAWSIAHPQAAVNDFDAVYPDNGSSATYNLDGWLATIPNLKGSYGLLTQRASEWTQTVSALKSVNELSTSFPASTYYTNEYLGG